MVMPRILLILILIGVVVFFAPQLFGLLPGSKTYITKDTTIAGDYLVEKGKAVVLKNGAKMVVDGKTTINGSLECENGPVSLEVRGHLAVNGQIFCNREEGEVDPLHGINIVILGDADFTETSVLASNSNIQVVDSPDLLLKTQEEIDKAFDEVAEDSGEGSRIGPFIAGSAKKSELISAVAGVDSQQPPSKGNKIRFSGKTIKAGDANKKFDKNQNLKKLPKKVERVVLLFKTPKGVLSIKDATFSAPDGQPGQDITQGCEIDIPGTEKDGEKRNGMRVSLWADNIVINNFYLNLGNGGRGGNATTGTDCYHTATAKAGHGGEPGNFKFSGANGIQVNGQFIINPGKGGEGGIATANARAGFDGCPGKAGGTTDATGGNGGTVKRTLSAKGNVGGTSKILIGSLLGGDGGDGNSNPGNGGNATKCDCSGGPAGIGTATAGKGGEASFTAGPGVGRLPGAEDKAGEDGITNIKQALAGVNGGICPKKGSGVSPDKPIVTVGHFEFLDHTSGSVSNSYGLLADPYIIVATPNGNPDLRGMGPFTIEVWVDGKLFWTGIIEDNPNLVCRGADGCSMSGKPVPAGWETIEVKAYDKDGNLIAHHTEVK